MKLLYFLKPIIVLIYLSAIATFAFICGAFYIGCPIDSLLVISSALIVFSIYAINRFTDKEDLINDTDKKLFFDKNPIILFLSISLLFLSTFTLFLFDKLTLFHILIIASGFAYSYKIIPSISKNRKIKFLRIKDILLAKSIIISLIWGASFFAISWAIYPSYIKEPTKIILLIIGCTIATFVNTNFADIRDYNGDLAFNIPTIPVRFGIRHTYIYAIILPSVTWFAVIIGLEIKNLIDWHTFTFLLINLLFPIVYIFGFKTNIISEKIIEPFADAYIGVFAVGLLILATTTNVSF